MLKRLTDKHTRKSNEAKRKSSVQAGAAQDAYTPMSSPPKVGHTTSGITLETNTRQRERSSELGSMPNSPAIDESWKDKEAQPTYMHHSIALPQPGVDDLIIDAKSLNVSKGTTLPFSFSRTLQVTTSRRKF
jgi:hypothetical protein